MKKTCFYSFLSAWGCAAILTAATPSLSAGETPEIAELKSLSQGFVAVGKKAIPAVVSIRVKIESAKNAGQLGLWGNPSDGDEQAEIFADPFWGQFFNFKGYGQSKPKAQTGQASGFIVTKDGYLLTNSHVVQEATEITVVLNDGREFAGKVIGQDPNTDIAVLKIEAQDLPTLTLGNSDHLEPGQWVIAIGSPLELRATLTVGVVSATGRNDLSIARVEDFIQTDAAINRGNSGGPLLDLNGEVIGINTAIVAGGYTGLGFAIPSNIAKNDMEQILAKGSVSRGFLGVSLQKIDKDLALAFHLDSHEGALVADISKGTPAEKAGLKQGDVIVKINQSPVLNVAALRNAIALMSPGSKILLGVLRDGKPLEIEVEIGDFPAVVAVSGEGVEDKKLGITIENTTAEIAKNQDLPEISGVAIKKVESGSLAAWAGLKKGAVILEVNKIKINNVEEYKKALQGASIDRPILLLIKQGKAVQYLSLKLS